MKWASFCFNQRGIPYGEATRRDKNIEIARTFLVIILHGLFIAGASTLIETGVDTDLGVYLVIVGFYAIPLVPREMK